MEYFVYPLSGMRKEAAISVKSAQRVANLIEKARDRGVKTLWGTTLGGNLLGGVGGAVGTDKLIDEYEKRRQEADPEYKTSVWTRAGLNGLGGLAGAFGGGYIGQRAGLSLGNKMYNKALRRGNALLRKHPVKTDMFTDMEMALHNSLFNTQLHKVK